MQQENSVSGKIFKEDLSAGCPPHDSIEPKGFSVLRFIKSLPVQEKDFHSHAKLGKPLPKSGHVSQCRWASCSVFKKKNNKNQIFAMKRLPRFKKFMCIAEIKLDSESGMLKETDPKSGHIDFWMYSEFDPVKAVIETIGV